MSDALKRATVGVVLTFLVLAMAIVVAPLMLAAGAIVGLIAALNAALNWLDLWANFGGDTKARDRAKWRQS